MNVATPGVLHFQENHHLQTQNVIIITVGSLSVSGVLECLFSNEPLVHTFHTLEEKNN